MTIAHTPNKFVTQVDGITAHLEYELAGQVMTITHTMVPDALGGRGIAAQLTQAAFDHARAEGFKIIPACSYAASWAKRHAQEQELLV
jgi:uncharacterized protein